MLVISNNCAGAHLYNKCNHIYNNPFMWGMVFAPEMIQLISKFSSIKWNRITPNWLTEDISAQYHYRYEPNIFGIRVDDVFTIYYTHYKYDANRLEPYRHGPDVFCRKHYEYAFNKFVERTKRFLSTSEEPSFLIVAYERYGWTVDTLNELVSTDTNYRVCLVTNRDISTKRPNVTVIKDSSLESKPDPVNIVTEYYTEIDRSLHLLKQ